DRLHTRTGSSRRAPLRSAARRDPGLAAGRLRVSAAPHPATAARRQSASALRLLPRLRAAPPTVYASTLVALQGQGHRRPAHVRDADAAPAVGAVAGRADDDG